jgi:metal-responsive CopG/Arc/MetJ family transcriptional regulator
MTKRRKVAVSISAEALAAAERLRKRTGESRSAVFERAVQGLAAEARHAERSRRYVNGYRRRPEGRNEVTAALRAAMTALATEPWDAAR